MCHYVLGTWPCAVTSAECGRSTLLNVSELKEREIQGRRRERERDRREQRVPGGAGI